MFRKKTISMVMVLAMISGASGFYMAKGLFSDMPRISTDGISEKTPQGQTAMKKPAQSTTETIDAAPVSTDEKITPSTKIVYQYYYKEDGVLEEQEGEPPYFLLDLTLQDMKEYYSTWQIISFSPREVVMRKAIDGKSSQHYIVGVKDGYIAVFYEEAQNGVSLHEITDTPVASLSHEEQVRLNDGIYVAGDEALARVMENYDS